MSSSDDDDNSLQLLASPTPKQPSRRVRKVTNYKQIFDDNDESDDDFHDNDDNDDYFK